MTTPTSCYLCQTDILQTEFVQPHIERNRCVHCKGTMEYVHKECQKESRKFTKENKCLVCKQEIPKRFIAISIKPPPEHPVHIPPFKKYLCSFYANKYIDQFKSFCLAIGCFMFLFTMYILLGAFGKVFYIMFFQNNDFDTYSFNFGTIRHFTSFWIGSIIFCFLICLCGFVILSQLEEYEDGRTYEQHIRRVTQRQLAEQRVQNLQQQQQQQQEHKVNGEANSKTDGEVVTDDLEMGNSKEEETEEIVEV
jgi:hypothetical protein